MTSGSSGRELTTERLRLRPFSKNDVFRLCALLDDHDIVKMTRTIPHPYTKDIASAHLDRTSKLIEEERLRQYAIARRIDGLLIGNLTLRKRSSADEIAELSYWLGKPFWGQGYVVEAACAALAAAKKSFGLTRANAAVVTGNHRSTRVLNKLGFDFERTVEPQGSGWDRKVELALYSLELGSESQS